MNYDFVCLVDSTSMILFYIQQRCNLSAPSTSLEHDCSTILWRACMGREMLEGTFRNLLLLWFFKWERFVLLSFMIRFNVYIVAHDCEHICNANFYWFEIAPLIIQEEWQSKWKMAWAAIRLLQQSDHLHKLSSIIFMLQTMTN